MSWQITGTEKTPVDRLGIANVSLLLHGDGADGSTTIADSSPSPKTLDAISGAQITTALADPFGNNDKGVIDLTPAGSHILSSSSKGLSVGLLDFTVELWVRPDFSSGNAFGRFFQVGNFTTNGGGHFQLVRNNTNQTLRADINFGGVGAVGMLATTTPLASNQWSHVALTRSGTTVRIFINGIQSASASSTSIADLVQTQASIGADTFGSNKLAGYFDEVRFTIGVARYTGNFTPPTAPFPDI
jgi:hypothetical protein